jgi:hypothetical protein
MIRFACQCGHQFILEDSQAAGEVQCPDCRKLNDVPTHGDLALMADDGTIGLKPLEIEEEPDRLALLSQIYAKGRQDESGNDIDFRPTPAEVAARGVPAPREPGQVPRPRYDPETGQLIRPIDVVAAPPRKALPVDVVTLGYVRHGTQLPGKLHGSLAILFMPANIITIAFVMIAMIIANIGAIASFTNYKVGLLETLFVELLIIGHYANVVEEIGVAGREEMPRLLRDMEFYGDIWVPIVNMFGSLMVCYAPTVLALRWLGFTTPGWIVAGTLAAIGTWLFPALLLTLSSSGSPANLRPDRVLGVIRACGIQYIPAMLLWTLAAGLFLSNTLVYVKLIFDENDKTNFSPSDWVIVGGALLLWRLLTVPMLHLFAIQLGLQYRRHYDKFPWIHQRHVRVAT